MFVAYCRKNFKLSAISLKNYLMIKICLIPKWFSFLSSDWLLLWKSAENLSTAQIAPISVCPKKFGRNPVHTETFSADGKIGDEIVSVCRHLYTTTQQLKCVVFSAAIYIAAFTERASFEVTLNYFCDGFVYGKCQCIWSMQHAIACCTGAFEL